MRNRSQLQGRRALWHGHMATRTRLERKLSEIWAQVLDVEKVGVHDNIFELGGGSLLATQVTAILSNAFRVKVPLQSLLDSPTVASMAAFIEEQQNKKLEDERLEQLMAEVEELTHEEAKRLLYEAGG